MPDWTPFLGFTAFAFYFSHQGPKMVDPPTHRGLVGLVLFGFVMLISWKKYSDGLAADARRDEELVPVANAVAGIFMVGSMIAALIFIACGGAFVVQVLAPFREKLPVSPEILGAVLGACCILSTLLRRSPWVLLRWACLCGALAWVGAPFGAAGAAMSKTLLVSVLFLSTVPIAQLSFLSMQQLLGDWSPGVA